MVLVAWCKLIINQLISLPSSPTARFNFLDLRFALCFKMGVSEKNRGKLPCNNLLSFDIVINIYETAFQTKSQRIFSNYLTENSIVHGVVCKVSLRFLSQQLPAIHVK